MSDILELPVSTPLTDADLGALLDSWIAAEFAPINGVSAESWQLSDAELLAELVEVQRSRSALEARWLKLLAEAESREATLRRASLPTAGWLVDRNTHSAGVARAEVRLATGLASWPVVAEALGAGRLSPEQAQVIVRGLGRLPVALSAEQANAVAADLVARGADFGPPALARLVNRAVEVVAPEVAEDADRRAVERIDADQQRDRYLTWRKDLDGSWLLSGKFSAVAGGQLIGVLRAVATKQRSGAAVAGVELSRVQAAADALVTLVEHFGGCQQVPKYGADRPRLVVNIDFDVLCGQLGTATLVNSNEPITAAQARRLACDASILPVVLGSASELLDVGREQRLFTSTLRQVLVNRDRGCAFPGCDRGPAECEGHHIVPWQSGGATSLENGVLVCSFHHHLIEPDPNAPPDRQWLVRLDAAGRPQFGAPVGRGAPAGQRRWRQHHRYRT